MVDQKCRNFIGIGTIWSNVVTDLNKKQFNIVAKKLITQNVVRLHAQQPERHI